MNLDGIGDVPEVRRVADLDAFRMQAETDRIHGVVRNREALVRDVRDHPPGAGLEEFDRRTFDVLPIDERRGETRAVYRKRLIATLAPADQAREAGDVIRMFVGDENGVDGFERLADGRETAREFAD